MGNVLDILARLAREPGAKKRVEEIKAAEAAAAEEVERPAYTPDELQEISALRSEPIVDKEIDGTAVSTHFDRFVETRNSEQVKAFTRLLLKHGFDLPQQRANQLAEIVAQNKERLKGGFYSSGLRDVVAKKLATLKESSERNVTSVILSNPKKFVGIFDGLYRRPPGGKPFMTPEEFERGKMPPKRRGPTA
ncbi:MAG: hypothetical protein WCX64_00215 [Candidatus Micrarchaeia archaeon]